MKPRYLGDCLDFYKRWFLAEFFPQTRLLAVPMLTEPWTEHGDADVYSELLKIEIIQPDLVPNCEARDRYFQPLRLDAHRDRDVFFDPDTGLRVGSRPSRRRFDEYVFAHEIQDQVLPESSSRVVVVYDQSISRGSEVESAGDKIRALLGLKLYALAYCAQAAMVVISRNRTRIEALYERAIRLPHLPADRVRINWDS